MKEVLIIDDDDFFCKIIKQQLEEEGYRCHLAKNLDTAKAWIRDNLVPDIILLDYDLGPRHETGIEACRDLKSLYKVPIILLTGNDQVDTVVSCLDAGADQYVLKPYVLAELLARMRASLRLYDPEEGNRSGEVITAEGLSLDTSSCTLAINGTPVVLTDMECAAATMLVRHFGENVPRDSLCQLLYDRSFDPSNRALDVLIGRVRRKITTASPEYKVRSVRGVGYRLCKAHTSLSSTPKSRKALS
ncbi:MAG: response regulator transcription factor [Porticoccaceae bacterium]|nr:response regulator transcription factor [Porticoccaceae bacterium]